MKLIRMTLALPLLIGVIGAHAQSTNTQEASTVDPAAYPTQTFYLANSVQANDANEIQVALRNILRNTDKIYLVMSQNAIVIQAPPSELALAQKLINDLDRTKKTYRLTYTVSEMDNSKLIGRQHFAMVVVTGQRAVLKQGSKVPVLTGSFTTGAQSGTSTVPGVQTQFQYLDVGMNFDATLDEFTNGVRLRTKVEQSSIAEERSNIISQDPIVRQTVLEGTSFLTLGKPLTLGSIDITGSTRHLDVEVLMEAVR